MTEMEKNDKARENVASVTDNGGIQVNEMAPKVSSAPPKVSMTEVNATADDEVNGPTPEFDTIDANDTAGTEMDGPATKFCMTEVNDTAGSESVMSNVNAVSVSEVSDTGDTQNFKDKLPIESITTVSDLTRCNSCPSRPGHADDGSEFNRGLEGSESQCWSVDTAQLVKWTRVDDDCFAFRTTRLSGPAWSAVVARETFDDDTGECLEPRRAMIGLKGKELHEPLDKVRRLRANLYFDPRLIADREDRQRLIQHESVNAVEAINEMPTPDDVNEAMVMSGRLKRQLRQQLKVAIQFERRGGRLLVSELFSPARLTAEARRRGLPAGSSFDIVTGCDLLKSENQERTRVKLAVEDPLYLMLSPPCTDMGPFSYINQTRLSDWMQRKRRAIRLWTFACRCGIDQVKRGGYVVLEHPLRSWAWRLACTKELLKHLHCVRGDSCAHGLRDPDTGTPILKPTRWATNDEVLRTALARRCVGDHEHMVIEGKLKDGTGRAQYCGKYWPRLVKRLVDGMVKGYENIVRKHNVQAVEDEMETVLEDTSCEVCTAEETETLEWTLDDFENQVMAVEDDHPDDGELPRKRRKGPRRP